MTKLRQTANPGDKASWTEHFYTGKLNVKDGEVETDNPVWVELLRQRGYAVVGSDAAAATETRKEELEATFAALDSEATTDSPPEQEQVPAGDASLEGKVDEGVVAFQLAEEGVSPEATESQDVVPQLTFEEAKEIGEAGVSVQADAVDPDATDNEKSESDDDAKDEKRSRRRKKENEHDSL